MGRQPRFADESSISRSSQIRAANLWLDARSLCAREKRQTRKTLANVLSVRFGSEAVFFVIVFS